jgi:hypothetical protein
MAFAVMLETEWQRAAQALLDWLEETGLQSGTDAASLNAALFSRTSRGRR